MWYESSNRLHGRTSNMYHPGRMVGGSSGGEACIVSGAGAAVGLGSDVGGSIRLPAHFNGVWGHKPSGGLVPNMGQYPAVDSPILCTGPLTRHAVDLWPLMRLLMGPPIPSSTAAVVRGGGDGGGDALPGVALSHAAVAGLPSARPVHGPSAALHPNSPQHVAYSGDGGWSLPTRTSGFHNGFLGHDPAQDTGKAMVHAMVGCTAPAAVSCVTLTDAAASFIGTSVKLSSEAPVSDLCVPDEVVPGIGSLRKLQSAVYGRMRVFVPRAQDLVHPLGLTNRMQPYVACSLQRCAAASAAITGTSVQELALPELSSAFDLWSALLRAEGGHMFKELLGSEPSYRSMSVAATLGQLLSSAVFDWCRDGGHPEQRVEQVPIPSDASELRPSASVQCEGLHDPFGARRRALVSAGERPPPEEHRAHSGATPQDRAASHPAPFTFPGLGLALIEELPQTLMPAFVEASRQRGLQLRQRLDGVLGRSGVLVMPVQPTSAQPHNAALWSFLNVGWTMLFNAALSPVTVVPCGLDEDGLPCGMQLVGARGSDVTTIALGVLLEATGGGSHGSFGWVPPRVVTSACPPLAGLLQSCDEASNL
jgi:hypothetical protein